MLRGATAKLLVTRLLDCASIHAARHQIHAFYYLWYGEPTTDGRFLHWDHKAGRLVACGTSLDVTGAASLEH